MILLHKLTFMEYERTLVSIYLQYHRRDTQIWVILNNFGLKGAAITFTWSQYEDPHTTSTITIHP